MIQNDSLSSPSDFDDRNSIMTQSKPEMDWDLCENFSDADECSHLEVEPTK